MNDGFIGLISSWFFLLFLWMGFFDGYMKKHSINKLGISLLLLLGLGGGGA